MDITNSTQAVGSVPQDLIEEQHTALMTWHANSTDLVCNKQKRELFNPNSYSRKYNLKERGSFIIKINNKLINFPFPVNLFF